jgi:transposase
VDTQDEGLALEMGVQVPRPRRFFPPEYKAEVVELIRTTGKTVGQVARELDLTETAVREWVRQVDLDTGLRSDGLTTAEREELRRLRRENRDLREEREILRKAAVFFVLLRGRPRSVTAQALELRECKIGITPFDCPRDNAMILLGPVGLAHFFVAPACWWLVPMRGPAGSVLGGGVA